jgi:co-chaperonin GroES (HSP10)
VKLVATNNYVVLKLRPKVTNSVIALPDKAQEVDDFCEVVGIGPEARAEMSGGLQVGIGDLVLRPVGLTEWHDEETDETFLVVEDADIVAVGVED